MIHKTEHFLSKSLKEKEFSMSIGEEQVECPLCMEPLELDDINFYPCTCGYQICRFCWNRIRTDENGLCPACRKSYPEDPAAFKPLTEDELQRIKRERKMKDLQRKQKAAENRKHLANVRVVQRNLVFAVGLSQRLADTEVLKKHDYFGKFGKIVKVVINQSTSYAGSQCSQGPSASAYITYQKAEDALRAIQAVNNIHVDGRTIKASLGTTKYCSHFLRGTQCPKPDCMYLHELGDEAASFTKEEMQQGKHQEYEQKLYEQYMNQLNSINATNQTTQPPPPQQPQQQQPQTSKTTTNQTRKKTHSPATTQRQTPPQSASQNHTDAWPSLQTGGQQPTQSKPSTDRTTNGTKGPPTSHSNLSNSFGSSTTTTSSSYSSSNSTGTTHKRNLSSDLHNRTAAAGGGGGGGSSQQRQTRTPDPHTTNRVQHSVTEGNCTQSQQQHQAHNNPHHQTNNPTPPQSLVNNCTPPQLSPPQIQTPPSQVTRQTPNVGSPKSPQPLAPQRKPLYGDSNTDSLSLFSNTGFPVNRHPLKHPGLQTAAFAAPPVNGGQDSKLNGPEIPDTISVSSSTDWQAAFGFQPSPMLSSHGIMDNGQKATSSRVLPQQTNHHNSVQDSNADDDLGFDPWNESTKALQDLIEKEAVSAASRHQPHPRHPLHQHPLAAQHQLNPLQQQRYQLAQQQMLGQEQTKPLPPGFTHNHLVLGGSRMMGVNKFGQSSSYPPPQHNGTGGMESLSDLALCGPLPRHGGPESFNMKSWQEGLRALLPNINIHFGGGGAANTTPLQGPVPPLMNNINPPAAGASGLPQQPAIQPANQKTVQPQKSPQNSFDLTCDPAILTSGNIADGPEEPHWMASLHHLTEDTAPSQQQHPAPLQQNLPYGSSRFLPLGLRHNPQTAGGAPFITPQPTAPPPGFQNSIRPPTHLASGMLESHKQLMDAFH